jgi:hypothetical protein
MWVRSLAVRLRSRLERRLGLESTIEALHRTTRWSRWTFGDRLPTFRAMADEAEHLIANGDLQAALSLQRHEVEGRLKRFGPNQRGTLIAQQRLISTLWELDEVDEANSLELEVHRRCVQTLGEHDINTLRAEYWLGVMQYVVGDDLQQAKVLLDRVVAGYGLLKGESDPATLRAKDLLDKINGELAGPNG